MPVSPVGGAAFALVSAAAERVELFGLTSPSGRRAVERDSHSCSPQKQHAADD